ncbi:MFS transporter [Saccharomonospora sp. CUA-673]|uniref:MFS transporter n=1 Tax=Saccharomonospora sp. CUA-673 TaxID=1904969 RepID=UPI00096778A9|nr:MFS transporter [Saccharomonospora sp. CUA-673]OLT48977.1 MFS transporter [Saccharomonospora sp. CUA-673]
MLASLRVANFRLYAIGQILSLLGTWIQRVAQDWLVWQISDGSPVALGLAVALQFVPMPVFTLWAGVLADRLDKRTLIIRLQYVVGSCAALLAVLDLTGAVQLWHVLALCLILGCASAVEVPVRHAFVMEIVGRDTVTNAVAVNSIIFNSARVAGPAIGGFLILLIGTGWLFALNAASLIPVVITLWLMNPDRFHLDGPDRTSSYRLRDVVWHACRHRDLSMVLALVLTVGTLGNTFTTSIPVLAGSVYGLGADGFGLLHTALAVGTFSGALLCAWRFTRDGPNHRRFVTAAAVLGVAQLGAALAPSLVWCVVGLVIAGAGQMVFTLLANAAVQLTVAPGMRGRMMALYLLLLLGGAPLGALLAGVLAEHVWPQAPLLLGGAACAVAALIATGAGYARRGSGPERYDSEREESESYESEGYESEGYESESSVAPASQSSASEPSTSR